MADADGCRIRCDSLKFAGGFVGLGERRGIRSDRGDRASRLVGLFRRGVGFGYGCNSGVERVNLVRIAGNSSDSLNGAGRLMNLFGRVVVVGYTGDGSGEIRGRSDSELRRVRSDSLDFR